MRTLKGKEIQFKYAGNLLQVYFPEGGQVPDCLSGFYTSEREATIAVHRYLEKATPKHAKGSLEKSINESVSREAV